MTVNGRNHVDLSATVDAHQTSFFACQLFSCQSLVRRDDGPLLRFLEPLLDDDVTILDKRTQQAMDEKTSLEMLECPGIGREQQK